MSRSQLLERLVQLRPDRRAALQPSPGNVDPVEQILLRRIADQRHQIVLLSTLALRRAHSLATVLAPAHSGDLAVRIAQRRRVLAQVNLNPPGRVRSFLLLLGIERCNVLHQPLGLPGLNVFKLLRELARIGRRRYRFLTQNRRRLVVPMSVPRSPCKPQDNYIGPETPDIPDDVP